MTYLNDLNPQQKEAAEHTKGPLMILAGAGAGKTKTITHRIAHLIQAGISPQSILAVTFTNKAAGEMRERVEALLKNVREANLPISAHNDNRLPFVATFHSLGVRLLREFHTHLNIPRSFTIWDRSDSIRAIKQSLTELGMEKLYEPRTILGKISRAKGDGYTLQDFRESANTPYEEAVSSVWERYEGKISKEGALDFDDLLLKTLILLREHADARARIRGRWQYLTIDEYQDTNRVQFEIARLLAEPENNICVVGDIDQNIYSWRGADIAHLLSFEDTYKNAKTVVLEQNYRSTQTILSAANDVISLNSRRHEKNLFTKNEAGEELELYSAHSEQDEARFITETIGGLIEEGTKPSEIAVLYRANFQSRALEDAFLTSGIPYRVLGTRFFERKEVKDTLSYLRAALNPQSFADISRIISVPPRGIGKQTLARMIEGKEELLAPAAQKKVAEFRSLLASVRNHALTKSPSEVIRYIAKASGLEGLLMRGGEEELERLENIKELVTLATKYDDMGNPEGSEKLIEDAALLGEQDSLDKNQPAVSLMTVHASKGLEFDVVFITGLEEGLFPHERHDESADEEEERRLFYVALTRARKRVFLTQAMTRMMYGSRDITVPSQFLGDISPGYLRHSDPRALPTEKVDLIDW